MVYYNEFDPGAAAWLRALIAAGHLPPGEVDERDLRDVLPTELRGFRQCRFFAGIGGWAYAQRLAGWPDDRPVWTGSCPCQPFSAAGKGEGFSDERHLWPAWFHLISQCRPPVVFGEQVASKDGLTWFDLVQADLEGAGYAVGAADLCAAGIGAPHIRQRLWFVADSGLPERGRRGTEERKAGLLLHPSERGSAGILADCELSSRRSEHEYRPGRRSTTSPAHGSEFGRRGPACRLADRAGSGGGAGLRDCRPGEVGRDEPSDDGRSGVLGDPGEPRLPAPERAELLGAGRREEGRAASEPSEASGGLAHGDGRFSGNGDLQPGREYGQLATDSRIAPEHPGPGPTNGFWRAADWLFCQDDKWRPVEPGTFPLASGVPARVGRLRGYGNSIVPQVAATFIEAYLDSKE